MKYIFTFQRIKRNDYTLLIIHNYILLPWDKINYKCESDDDCSVMNTHNCYHDGYYTESLNKDSIIPSIQQVRPF